MRFTRNEFKRALEGLSETEARLRFLPMNCISWNIGHMAWQEQRYWLTRLQGHTPLPHLNELVGYGQLACTPPLAEMWEAWQTITHLAPPFLDTLTTKPLQEIHYLDDQQTGYTAGMLLQRVIYHYWYHTGENAAIRQMLGHPDLPEFVGNIDDEAPYRPEAVLCSQRQLVARASDALTRLRPSYSARPRNRRSARGIDRIRMCSQAIARPRERAVAVGKPKRVTFTLGAVLARAKLTRRRPQERRKSRTLWAGKRSSW